MRSILICLFLFFLCKISLAQPANYQISAKEKPLIEVLNQLENDLGLLFSYQPENVEDIRINLELKTDDYSLLMERLLAETDLEFEIVDENFVVIRKKAAPEKITISGSVTDAESQTPLPLANIIIQGKNIGTYTNDDGSFSLEYPFTGTEKISVNYVGYEERVFEVSEFTQNKKKEITLAYPSVKEAFVVITDYLTDGVSVEHNGASTDLKPKLVGNLGGNVEPDVLSMIQFLPGVSTPSSRVSDLYIRGCTPDQNLIIWEDIPIYHAAHYFGMISAFNPYVIEEARVYRGGFDATYGGRIAGVIEMESGNEETYKNERGAGINMTHGQAYLHQKFGKKKPFALTASLRRSFGELLETPTLRSYSRYNQQGFVLGGSELVFLPEYIDIQDDFYFFDTHLKLSGKVSERDRFEIAGTFAENDFTDKIVDSRGNRTQHDTLFLDNLGLSLKWQHQWNDQWQTELKAAGTKFQFDYDYDLENIQNNQLEILGEKTNTILDQQFQLNQIYQTETAQKWQMGYHLTHYDVDYKIKRRAHHENEDQGKRSRADLHALYVDYQNPIENKIGVQAGLRLSYYAVQGRGDKFQEKIYPEPRIRLDYRLSDALTLHANYGRHHQFIGQLQVFKGNDTGINTPIWRLAEERGVDMQSANIYQVGAIFQRKSWVIDLQAYVRQVGGLNSRAYGFELPDSTGTAVGSAYVRGLDVLVKKRFGKLRSWVSYSLSQVDWTFESRDGDVDIGTFAADHDQRHVFHWSNQLRVNNWQLAAGLRAASGLPYTVMEGFNVESEQGEPFEYEGIFGDLNDERLKSTFAINVSGVYRFQPKNKQWRAFAGFSIMNLLNQKNEYERNYTVFAPINGPTSIDVADKSQLRFTPNVSVRVEW